MLPSNFYSLTPSAETTAEVMVDFIQDQYPKEKVFVITEVTCKSCIDLSTSFNDFWKKRTGEVPLTHSGRGDLIVFLR